MIHIAQNFWMR